MVSFRECFAVTVYALLYRTFSYLEPLSVLVRGVPLNRLETHGSKNFAIDQETSAGKGGWKRETGKHGTKLQGNAGKGMYGKPTGVLDT